ncbi:uncharacterized protein LOC135839169 isoform X2 [Planococcus citri]|uniref:uncharacterized protein LOC135839169 isoform X2 n=1 Tax=Planococcus citri TaxID=170843 RepID=UPI0031F7D1D0
MVRAVLFLCFTLFCCATSANTSHVTKEAGTKMSTTSIIAVDTTYPTSTPILQENLIDTSIQETPSSDQNANDEIEKKIINAFTEFSSNCNVYNRMELSLKNFTFPKKSVNCDLGLGINASLYNVAVGEYFGKFKSYSTLIGCDSSKKAKVEVTLPSHIRIVANVEIIEKTYPSNGLITILLRNGSISKQFFFQVKNSNHEDNIMRKISYSNSKVYLDNIDTKYQKLIYSNLEEILSEIESSVEQHLVDQLSAQLSENNIDVGQSCSKFVNIENYSKKINWSSSNSDFNHLYAIPNVSLVSWEGVNLRIGPMVVKGISQFSSIELSILGTELASAGDSGLFYSTPRYDDPEQKEMTVRIKTSGLKGKLDWSYNSKQRSFPFFIDSVLFEIEKNKTSKFTPVHWPYSPRKSYNKWYSRSEEDTVNVDVLLGNIKIESPSFREDKKEFVNFALLEHLKMFVKDSLKNSLANKLKNNSSIVSCR